MIPRALLWLSLVQITLLAAEQIRPFKDDADARHWLQNMVGHHRFTVAEVKSATGLPAEEIEKLIKQFEIGPGKVQDATGRLLMLPYPGGRHPRIGFLDGAVDPQRETKISVFTPWDAASYVVVDIPEAIWSNLGLTYLAHTHVPTIWSKDNVELPQMEWERLPEGVLRLERKLPNGIVFGTEARAEKNGVRMREWLRNGTDKTLTDLRVQNCVMLKGARGFTEQTNANKVFASPYCAAKSSEADRWIITGWTPIHRAWGNPPCPCLHADPKFPDCAPGQTVETRGWLSFYEGADVKAEFLRLDSIGWK